MKTLFSLIESPSHPDFSALYQKLGLAAERFDSARSLHRAMQKQPPDCKKRVRLHSTVSITGS
jgi:hypothetical protein